jgi:hypothetical protein
LRKHHDNFPLIVELSDEEFCGAANLLTNVEDAQRISIGEISREVSDPHGEDPKGVNRTLNNSIDNIDGLVTDAAILKSSQRY